MRSRVVTGAVLALAATMGIAADRQPNLSSESGSQASAFVQLMQTGALDAIAVADPDEPGRYLAAMVFPGAQILFITGRYSAPVLMNERLVKNDFKGAYIELNSAADKDGRLFVQDMGANGLRAARAEDGGIDIVYESMVTQTTFDGEWSKQKLSRDSYMERFTGADTRYARGLQLFVTALKQRATSPASPGPAHDARP